MFGGHESGAGVLPWYFALDRDILRLCDDRATVPDLAGLRRLSLAELDHDTLMTLVRHGEDLLVERKVRLPDPPKFGAAVGSFANTLGGWVLLGIADDGHAEGWTPPGHADVQSYLGSVLRQEIDPLPPFVAAKRKVEDKSIGVVRVFASADAPHIVRGTGAVYVRSSKGKEPVDDHRTLLELARRGDDANHNAGLRLRQLPTVGQLLRTPDTIWSRTVLESDQQSVRFIARAAPLTVTPALGQWPLTESAASTCLECADQLLPQANESGMRLRRDGPWPEPFARAIAVRLEQYRETTYTDGVTVIADSGGVIAIELRRGTREADHPTILVNSTLDEEIRPLVSALSDLLTGAEAIGRAIVDMWMLMPGDAKVYGEHRESPRELHFSGELTIPAAPDEVEALASAWHREFQRTIGIVKYENG
jgi:hypothetical protein